MRASATKRGYNGPWRRTRKRYLRKQPHCLCGDLTHLALYGP
jgi:hypothetical protein